MSALRDRPGQASDTPTAEHPTIVEVGYESHLLSRCALWREEGDWVVRSLDYDVIAAHENLGGAIVQFIQRTKEYADALAEDESCTRADMVLALTIYRRMATITTAINGVDDDPVSRAEMGPRRTGGLADRLRNRRGQAAPRWSLRREALT